MSYDRRAFTDISMADAQYNYMDDLLKEVMNALGGLRYKVAPVKGERWGCVGVCATHRVRIVLELEDNGGVSAGVASTFASDKFPMAPAVEWDATVRAGFIVQQLMKLTKAEAAKYIKR